MAITKVELIQLLRGFADNDEVESITFERDKKDVSDSFRNLPIFVYLLNFSAFGIIKRVGKIGTKVSLK